MNYDIETTTLSNARWLGLRGGAGFGLGILALIVIGLALVDRDFMVANVNVARPPWVEGG